MARRRQEKKFTNLNSFLKSSQSNKKRQKSLSDHDKEMLIRTVDDLKDDIIWLYDQIVKRRKKITPSLRKSVKEDILNRNNGDRKHKLFSLKDICKLMDWTYPRNKEERKRLCNINSKLFIANLEAHYVLYNFTIKALKQDIKNPSDLLLSKKEQKAARKRRRIEKKNDTSFAERVNIPKTDDQKKEARKERARIRREAKSLGITTAEYKEKVKQSKIKD